MGKNELTKVEALKLITPVVDGEASDDEYQAFMNFIEHHPDVRDEYESIKNLKSVVGSKYQYAKAPASLQSFVKQVAANTNLQDDDIPIYDIPTGVPGDHQKNPANGKAKSKNSVKRYLYSAAAAVLIIFLAGWTYFNFTGDTNYYNIEQNVYEHFEKHEGKFVEPTIATASLGSAEIRMASDYDMPMTIPELENAEFKGIVYDDFIPDYKAPMLEYYIPSQDQYIYIFAFKLDKLKESGQLIRHKEAIQKCTKPEDFHVQNVNGKHVVSWKWNDVWYAGISNHTGDSLAALIKPLQYDSKN